MEPKKLIPICILDRAQQIAEDKWDTWQECLSCNENTTVKEIADWIKTRTGYGGVQTSCKIVFGECI